MENNGSGSTLTPGVSTQVRGNVVNLSEYRAKRESVSNSDIPSRSNLDKVESKPIIETTGSPNSAGSVEISGNQSKISGNQELADVIFEIAKTHGIDRALEELANQDIKESVLEESKRKTVKEEVIDAEVETDETQKKSKEQMQLQKIAFLESTVANLNNELAGFREKNAELTERVTRAEERNTANVESMRAMLAMLAELIEEEKEKDEDSLLAKIAKIIAEALTLILVNEEGQKELAEENKAA